MRKWYSIVFAFVLLSLLLTGCADPSSYENKQSLAQTDTTASSTTDKSVPVVSASTVSETVDRSAQNAPNSTSSNTGEVTISSVPSSANDKTISNPVQISRDEAKRIALERAGVTTDQIFDYGCELDYDEDTRVWEYEISFNVGRTEYECDIRAEDGTIISFRTEFDD